MGLPIQACERCKIIHVVNRDPWQPIAALHGHIHESAGMNRIGRTLCVNPGSDYHTGRIAGCLFQLRGDDVRHQFVTG